MSKVIAKPGLLDEIREYGAFDIKACFNCGNCTAICPLTDENNAFPRSVIRMAQLGLKESLLGSEELWACYFCGECTDTCPREADPAGFMMATRRYAIAKSDFTGLGSRLYKHPWLYALLSLLIGAAVVFASIWVADTAPFGDHEFLMFGKDYYAGIHLVGMALGALVAIIAAVGTYKTYRTIAKAPRLWRSNTLDVDIGIFTKLKAAIKAFVTVVTNEMMLQKRYKRDEPVDPWYISRWFLHLTMVWGFCGLMLATALNWLVKDLIQGEGGKSVDLWYPIRLLGIISGLIFMYGTTITLAFRLIRRDTYYSQAQFSDWLFLFLMWANGASGFLVTILVYIPEESQPAWAHWALVIHVLLAVELLVLAPFTKFAHAVYRPVALWIFEIRTRLSSYVKDAEEERVSIEIQTPKQLPTTNR